MFNLGVFSCFSILDASPSPLGQILTAIARKKQKSNPDMEILIEEVTRLLNELEKKLAHSSQELEEQINSRSIQKEKLKAVFLEIEECKKLIAKEYRPTMDSSPFFIS